MKYSQHPSPLGARPIRAATVRERLPSLTAKSPKPFSSPVTPMYVELGYTYP